MEYLWKKYKPNELYFDDDNFAFNQSHVREICNEVVRRKLNISWNCMVDALISFDLMKLMKKAGCTGITIGAESADDNVLKAMEGKPIRRADIEKFVDYCRRLKIRSHVCWVLGMKGSTKESDMETIKFALNLKSDSLQFSLCVPYLGTKLYDWCKENKYFATTDWNKFLGSDRAIVDLPGYSHKEVENIHKTAGKMWYRKMLFKRPDILVFHLYNVYKYQGFKGLVDVSKKSLKMIK
jgi:radical SAM superfamily enzyme YgiQ (UPF0313 family)